MEKLIKAIQDEITQAFRTRRDERGWSNYKLGDIAFGKSHSASKDKVLGLLSGKRAHYTIEDYLTLCQAFGENPVELLAICIHSAKQKLSSE